MSLTLIAKDIESDLEETPEDCVIHGYLLDPDTAANLLGRHREALRERDTGPHRVVEGVATYLAAEQRAGQVAPTARPDVVAELIVGACLHRAFLIRFADDTAPPEHIGRFAADIVTALESTLSGS